MRADITMAPTTGVRVRRGVRRWLAGIALCAILGGGVMAGQVVTHVYPATALSSHPPAAMASSSGSDATGGGGPPRP